VFLDNQLMSTNDKFERPLASSGPVTSAYRSNH
jgi:hypothetical protein